MSIHERLLRFQAQLWSAVLDTPYATAVVLLVGAGLGAWLAS